MHICTYHIRISCEYVHVRNFRWLAMTNCFKSILNFGKISMFKSGVFPRKQNESEFLVNMRIYSVLFVATNFHEILSSGFKGVPLTKKKKLDWLTDWLMDRSKLLHPTLLIAWGTKRFKLANALLLDSKTKTVFVSKPLTITSFKFV